MIPKDAAPATLRRAGDESFTLILTLRWWVVNAIALITLANMAAAALFSDSLKLLIGIKKGGRCSVPLKLWVLTVP